jgi:imidazolonepropionase-like amidohydrolase
MKRYHFLTLLLLFPLLSFHVPAKENLILLKDATLLDGNGGQPRPHTDILIKNNLIAEVGSNLKAPGAQVINCSGKTIMPAIISAHVHIGMIS